MSGTFLCTGRFAHESPCGGFFENYTFGELAADNIKNSGGILVILSNRVWARDFLFSSGAISQGFNELTSQRV